MGETYLLVKLRFKPQRMATSHSRDQLHVHRSAQRQAAIAQYTYDKDKRSSVTRFLRQVET